MNHLFLTIALLLIATIFVKHNDPRVKNVLKMVKYNIKIILVKLRIVDPREIDYMPSHGIKDFDNSVPENKITTKSGVNLNLTTNRTTLKSLGPECNEPPYQRCYECELNFQCSNYPYELGDKHGSVCSKCNMLNRRVKQNYNSPTVMGRANGRPRQCNKLF